METAQVSWTGSAESRDVRYEYGDVDPQAVDRLVDQDGGKNYAGFGYDLAGNMVKREGPTGLTTLTWDGMDRLRLADAPDGPEIYYYDHEGNRLLAINESQGSRFWFAERETHFELGGAEVGRYLHLSDGASTVARVDETNAIELQYADALQNLMLAVDAQGSTAATFFYGPFGEVLQSGGADQHRRQFNGKENDKVTGLRYYGFRYYDPLTLRWNSADPLYRAVPDLGMFEPQRMNLYSFSMNNPVRYYDPDGRDAEDENACMITDACDPAAEIQGTGDDCSITSCPEGGDMDTDAALGVDGTGGGADAEVDANASGSANAGATDKQYVDATKIVGRSQLNKMGSMDNKVAGQLGALGAVAAQAQAAGTDPEARGDAVLSAVWAVVGMSSKSLGTAGRIGNAIGKSIRQTSIGGQTVGQNTGNGLKAVFGSNSSPFNTARWYIDKAAQNR